MPKQNGNPKILAAGAAVQLLTGIPAAWGVFQKPVMAQYGFSRGQAMLSFAILVAGYGIGCAIGGFVQDQHGPRYAALWGTALLGGGTVFILDGLDLPAIRHLVQTERIGHLVVIPGMVDKAIDARCLAALERIVDSLGLG